MITKEEYDKKLAARHQAIHDLYVQWAMKPHSELRTMMLELYQLVLDVIEAAQNYPGRQEQQAALQQTRKLEVN